MSKFSVTGYPRVNIRCQFDEIPGVTHIELVFDPHSRCNQVSGKIDSAYGEFLINDQVVISAISGEQAGSLYILKKEVFEEIAEAIKEGFKTLQSMIKASEYKSCGF